MSIADAFLAEYEHETNTTRKFLERLPQDKLEWKPHPKSMTAGQLALHIAEAPGSVVQMAGQDVFEFTETPRPFAQPESVEQILTALDASCEQVKAALSKWSDEFTQATWRMQRGGKQLLALPRSMVLRSILLNHWYHHRGQFGVYLRLVGAQVPSSYGPSGDEQPDFLQ